MKKVFYAFGLLMAGMMSVATAQDNPCGVEGIVVEAQSFSYTPSDLEIESGQTVVWVNVDGFHDVNGAESTLGDMWNNPESFSFGAVNGSTEGVCIGSHTFTVEGTYNYDCSIGSHAANGMVATITVVPTQQSNTVVDVIVNSDDHTLLEAAVIEAGLAEALSGDGPFTVFAPTDDAIVALTEELGITAEDLLALPNLGEILQYHVVAAAAFSTDLSDGQSIATLLGEEVTVTVNQNGVMINNAMVTVADIAADNGVVHVIDAVLLPPPAETTVVDIIVESELHTILEAAVIAADLATTLSGEGPFTVFAPTDAAFEALMAALGVSVEDLLEYPELTNVLLGHVVAGQALASDLSDGQQITTLLDADVVVSITADGVFINQAQVIVADVTAGNGVVHVIDAVLLPPTPPSNTVVDIIVNSDDHTLLEAAVIEAGLVEALSGEGPFTVFAPNDAAVVALTEALGITAEELLALPNLGEILQYHVVGASAYAADLSDGQMITTLLGEDVTVSITAEGVMINNAMVIVADIAADNGVVHVIDAVLLPPTANAVNEADQLAVMVYPNPAGEGELNIRGNWNAGALIQVWDGAGRQVAETTANQSWERLSTQTWNAGLYIVRVTEGAYSVNKMFLVN
ncbi:MAG TPA: fasciclin [Flavobacteriales bacterium]|nr:fasciclin [Flavobacteriales bacterium]